jgi:hypothetical protein
MKAPTMKGARTRTFTNRAARMHAISEWGFSDRREEQKSWRCEVPHAFRDPPAILLSILWTRKFLKSFALRGLTVFCIDSLTYSLIQLTLQANTIWPKRHSRLSFALVIK